MNHLAEFVANLEWYVTLIVIVCALFCLARIYVRHQIASGTWPMIRLIRDNAEWLSIILFATATLIYINWL